MLIFFILTSNFREMSLKENQIYQQIITNESVDKFSISY